MGKIALFGAAGAIGQSIADALRAEGTSNRVVGRSRSALETEYGADPLAEVATWNPDDEASIREAASGIETIVYLPGPELTPDVAAQIIRSFYPGDKRPDEAQTRFGE